MTKMASAEPMKVQLKTAKNNTYNPERSITIAVPKSGWDETIRKTPEAPDRAGRGAGAHADDGDRAGVLFVPQAARPDAGGGLPRPHHAAQNPKTFKMTQTWSQVGTNIDPKTLPK